MPTTKLIKPAKTFPPGYFIREAMNEHGISDDALSAILKIKVRELNRLLKDEAHITPEIATKLGKAFNSSTEFWLNLELNYRKRIQSSPLVKQGGARLGGGIYSIPDLAMILNKSTKTIRRWVEHYWDKELGEAYESRYSWNIEFTKAIDFHTMIELVIFAQLREQKLSAREIIKSHKYLSKKYDTPYPFANREVLQFLQTDGIKAYIHDDETTETADGSRQLNLSFVAEFFKELDFGADNLATLFWPRGKSNSVVVDPKRQFGHPVIAKTNIYPETIYNMYKAQEPIPFIAFTYEITEKEVKDAIEYCSVAA